MFPRMGLAAKVVDRKGKPPKISYRWDAETDILTGAAAYANAPDGIVPWRERPTIFRKQSLARIPPMVSA